MQVRAKKLGVYGARRRRPGDIFILVPRTTQKNGKEVMVTVEQQFSSKWMEKIAQDGPVPKGAGPSKVATPPSGVGPAQPAGEARPTGDQDVLS
jgi:hypothetical protein